MIKALLNWGYDMNTLLFIKILISDLALIHDEAYKVLVEDFATNEENLNTAFRHAWYS